VIRTSSRFWDTAFVARTIRELRLDPKPVNGFAQLPGARWEDADWSRVIESYPWGFVLFLSDKQNKQHATVVVDRVTPIGPAVSWYDQLPPVDIALLDRVPFPDKEQDVPELIEQEEDDPDDLDDEAEDAGPDDEFVDEDDYDVQPGAESSGAVIPARVEPAPVSIVPTTDSRPPCVGFHDELDKTCEGGYIQNTGVLDPPCTWRERCMALQEHCRIQCQTIDKVLKGRSDSDIRRMTETYLEQYGPFPLPATQTTADLPVEQIAPPGIVKRAVVDIPPPGGDSETSEKMFIPGKLPALQIGGKKESKAPAKPATAITSEEVRKMADEFWDKLVKAFGLYKVANEEAPKVGGAYLQVVQSGPGYWTGFRRMADGDMSFIRIHLKPNLGGLHIHFPFDTAHPIFDPFGDKALSWRHGSFKTVIKGVGKTVPIDDVIAACVKHKADFNIGLA
jgi:hypothetical protein